LTQTLVTICPELLYYTNPMWRRNQISKYLPKRVILSMSHRRLSGYRYVPSN